MSDDRRQGMDDGDTSARFSSSIVHRPSSILDAGHESCGVLLILIRQRMRALAPGEVLQVIAYDRGALLDIPAWCWLTNNTFLLAQGDAYGDEALHFFIRREAEAVLGRNLDVYKEHNDDETAGEHHAREG